MGFSVGGWKFLSWFVLKCEQFMGCCFRYVLTSSLRLQIFPRCSRRTCWQYMLYVRYHLFSVRNWTQRQAYEKSSILSEVPSEFMCHLSRPKAWSSKQLGIPPGLCPIDTTYRWWWITFSGFFHLWLKLLAGKGRIKSLWKWIALFAACPVNCQTLSSFLVWESDHTKHKKGKRFKLYLFL